MDDLLNVLPDASDLRTAARILREEGQYEIAMRLEDSARIVRRYEMSDRYAVTSDGRDALRQMDLTGTAWSGEVTRAQPDSDKGERP